jgi:hypothetical protein
VSLLVLDAFIEDQDGGGVALGDLYGVGQFSQIEVGGVPTPKEVYEIAGRQQQTPGENLHR